MDWLYNQLIANKQKAVVGFIMAALTAFFVKHGIDITTLTVHDALQMLFYGALGFVGVYLKRNKG